jgi:hypothetical protein
MKRWRGLEGLVLAIVPPMIYCGTVEVNDPISCL